MFFFPFFLSKKIMWQPNYLPFILKTSPGVAIIHVQNNFILFSTLTSMYPKTKAIYFYPNTFSTLVKNKKHYNSLFFSLHEKIRSMLAYGLIAIIVLFRITCLKKLNFSFWKVKINITLCVSVFILLRFFFYVRKKNGVGKSKTVLFSFRQF